MLDLAIAALHAQDPGQLWPPVISELLRACDGQFLILSEKWTDHEGAVHLWMPDGTVKRHTDPHAQRLIGHCYPLAGHYMSSLDRTPVTACQVVGEREWHTSSTAKLMRQSLGADNVLGLPVPDAAKPVRGMLVYRTDSGFTPAHLAYARRIQPLLAGVDRQVRLLRRWRASAARISGDSPRDPAERLAESGLTPREVTVLVLLTDALTAHAIGRRLGISVRTVQKHVESIYRKLGTKDRVATVLRAQQHGLVPVGGAQAA